jgi:hypothetical protein
MPAYPREHLHRIAYTALSSGQIDQALAAVSGPVSVSPLSDEFAGEMVRIVTDNGPTLEYSFSSANELSVSENGGAGVDAGYGALVVDHVCLFSHLVPGTQRGYHVVIDRDTRLVTVVETWFSGEVFIGTGDARRKLDINREVQREIYFGYLDDGSEAPTARHVRTNRVEGKGFAWTKDTGEKTLEYYSTVFYSNFVELSRTGGELGFCAPSDYVRINEDVYVHQRTECEFSGKMTLQVMNVATQKMAGVILGFDEADALTYRMFTATGEWVGQVAQFEAFGDITGGTVMPAPADGSALAKGARRVYRPARTYIPMSKAEVDAAVAASTRIFQPSAMAGNRTPPSDYLAGKSMTLRWDNGSTIEYRFETADRLLWRRAGESSWSTETYQAMESTHNVIMFGHLMTGAPNHDGQIIVADFDHGLATLIHGTLGTPWYGQEAAAKTIFGVIEMEGMNAPIYRRHQFTNELVGRCLTWNYSPGLTSMHLYATPNTVSWIIFGADGAGGMSWAGPSQQVKIRDGIYLTYWLEEACNGTLGTILINMRTMHDCGIGYHGGEDGLSLSPVGAHARHAGRFDVARFFEIGA